MKKTPATFLTTRELKTFEITYSRIQEFPGFRMENIFNYQTRENYAAREQIARILQRDFGFRSSKLSVALHEAGHAIVMAATHGRVEEAVIYSHGESYEGYVKAPGCTGDQDYEPIEYSALPPKAVTHGNILIDSAGFVAEGLFSATHSSAYHEKFLVFAQSRYLDEASNKVPLHHWNYFIHWCSAILKRNQSLFHEITYELLKRESLSLTGNDQLQRQIKKEPLELFF